MRKKKTPEELAAEAELADADDFTSKQTIIYAKKIKSRKLICQNSSKI